jgi:hypothetical protein
MIGVSSFDEAGDPFVEGKSKTMNKKGEVVYRADPSAIRSKSN